MNNWAVYRQDFTGNEFLVEKGLTESRARELVVEYESHKHHQHYWADKQPSATPNLVAITKQMLADGSSIRLTIPVLVNYNATKQQIVDALTKTTELDIEDIASLVDELSKKHQTE